MSKWEKSSLKSRNRPKLVTALALGVLILAMLQLARFGLSLALPPLPLTVPPIYLTLTGAVWGLGALAAAWALFTGQKWAPGYVRWGFIAYTIWYWADRLLLVRTDYARQTILASIVITIVLLVAGFWVLQVPKVERYYREEQL